MGRSMFENSRYKDRLWEVDLLRGGAVVAMVLFHLLWDLDYMDVIHIDLYAWPESIFVYSIGTAFLFLVGLSLALSSQRARHKLERRAFISKYLVRGGIMFLLGMLISLFTWIAVGDDFVRFGVLHCIGISIILAVPLLNLKWSNLVMGAVFVVMGPLIAAMRFDFQYLFWLGFVPEGFHTIDYFPLLPWFGVVLLGLFAGKVLYPHSRRAFRLVDLSSKATIRAMTNIGRHSLFIYFIHQPILLGTLFLLL